MSSDSEHKTARVYVHIPELDLTGEPFYIVEGALQTTYEMLKASDGITSFRGPPKRQVIRLEPARRMVPSAKMKGYFARAIVAHQVSYVVIETLGACRFIRLEHTMQEASKVKLEAWITSPDDIPNLDCLIIEYTLALPLVNSAK